MRIYKYLLTFFLISFISKSEAQILANFSVDKSSGCSPLTVSFTNTTAGASPSATYNWNFGNGNTITNSNVNQAATYINQQTYTVILTVIDKGAKSIKSMDITVLYDPTASFIVSDSVGCTPKNVTFTSTSTSGSGLLNSFFWDFGDGNTVNGDSTLKTVSHLYTTNGKYTVKLNVQSTSGCAIASLTKTDFINAQLKPKAAYVRNKAFLCQTGDSVKFTNNSANTNQASYLWSFGDLTTSISFSPTHIYSSKGIFQDSLIVTNSDGCSDTAISATPLFIATFQSNFVSTGLCAKINVLFTNSSLPAPDLSVWQFSNNANPVKGLTATDFFNNMGSYGVTLINTFGACKDTVNKQITVVAPLTLSSFAITNTPACGDKTSVMATDTSIGGVSWAWNVKGMSDTLKTQSVNYIFKNDNTYLLTLFSKQPSGCVATVTDTIVLPKSSITITSTSSDSLSNTSGCVGLKVDFLAQPANGIKSYSWDFGDGGISTDSAPSHIYSSVGLFPVKLIYTSSSGCSDTVWLRNIQTFAKPVPSFVTRNKINCGGKAYFTDQTPAPVNYWSWDFGDSSGISHDKNPIHIFRDTGYYDIKLTAFNGTCFDSVTFPKYIYILPPFLTDTAIYTCNGLRDTISFKFGYRFVQSPSINFGDSSPTLNLDTSVHTVSHVFPRTGIYLTTTTANYGQCKVIDSLYLAVLTKQNPLLSTNVSEVCENDSIRVFIDTSTLQKNPLVNDKSNQYNVFKWQMGDTTTFNGGFTQQPLWYYNKYFGTLSSLPLGNDSFRVILESRFFGCRDTTNYIKVKVKGPMPAFSIANPMGCFKLPIKFNDNSQSTFGIPIVKWIWSFGDLIYDTSFTNASVSHIYPAPGRYLTYLKVIDQDGCFAQTNNRDTAMPKGPKADFLWNPAFVITNTTANFINNTNTFEDNKVNYKWSFTSNGGFTTNKQTNINIFYPSSLTDTVMLIAADPNDGCTDTIIKLVRIKDVFALFTYTTKYIGGNNNCPPLVAAFTSHSINADKIRWDFGDGTPGSGITTDTIARHTYNIAGIYVVTLYAYKNNQLIDSLSTTLVIKGALAKLHTDISMGCVPTSVNFSVTESNSLSYTWDFGDGVVIQNTHDSAESHLYTYPGLYTANVALIDINGCQKSFFYPYRILIDTLSASFKPSITPICDSGNISFISTIHSLSVDSLQAPLLYHWNFGTGKAKDTSNLSNPSFFYRLGKYPVSQQITSIAGCVSNFTDTISVVRSARGTVSGPLKICDSLPATFTGSVVNKMDSVAWLWKFGNGDSSILQNPNPVYLTTGKDSVFNDTVLLITQLNNCFDTTKVPLVVNPRPFVGLIANTNKVCIGIKATLTASDGSKNNYKWSPAGRFINDSSIEIMPLDTTKYFVTVTNKYKCTNTDSTIINVVKHLPLVPLKNADVCIGKSIQLPVFGADSYRWLSDIATIKAGDLNSSSPTVTPVVSPTTYVVQRINQCSVQTVSIIVTLQGYPTVKTRDTLSLLTGSVVQLQSNVSSDVVSYQWSPPTYLSCTDCQTPVSSPRTDITYTVVVANKYGCTATTDLKISLLCSQSLFIPTAFAPDGQSNNRVFYPLGRGIRIVNHFAIYDRLGHTVFEKNNIQINDKTAGWTGTIYGTKAPPGTYVYLIEAVCDTGETLPPIKGTVVLIR